MAILSKGTSFQTGSQVTALLLNNLVDNATFTSGAVDDSTTALDGNGKIIVKDGGITTAKLNLSATGVSQNIASFKTVQDGNNRSLDIRTPASTTDLNSPFELATGNAIKFLVDTNEVVINSSGNVGIGTDTPSTKLEIKAPNNTDTTYLLKLINGSESGFTQLGAYGLDTSAIDLILKAGGNEGLRVDKDSGRVGIGVIQPQEELHVAGSGSGDPSILLENTSAGSSNDTIIRSKVAGSGTSGVGRNFIYFGDAADDNAGFIQYSHTNDSMHFFTSVSEGSPTEKVRITSDGNVGIGTTSPDGNLHVVGATGDKGRIFLSDKDNGSASGDALAFVKDGVNASLVNRDGGFLQLGANNSHFVTLSSGGNVGIGTDSPSKLLSVVSPNTATAETVAGFGNQNIERGLEIKTNGGASSLEWGFNAVNSRHMVFDTNQTERMRITSSGDVLLGTTSSGGGAFDGNSIKLLAGAGQGIHLSRSITAAANQITFQNNNGQVGFINTEGSATIYSTSSDYRLKEDIVEMQDSISKVQSLKPVNFAWKVDGTRVDGFLAHEAQEVVPAAVTGTKDAVDEDGQPDYQGIDQSKLVPLLTKALQEALTKIESLEARVTALES